MAQETQSISTSNTVIPIDKDSKTENVESSGGQENKNTELKSGYCLPQNFFIYAIFFNIWTPVFVSSMPGYSGMAGISVLIVFFGAVVPTAIYICGTIYGKPEWVRLYVVISACFLVLWSVRTGYCGYLYVRLKLDVDSMNSWLRNHPHIEHVPLDLTARTDRLPSMLASHYTRIMLPECVKRLPSELVERTAWRVLPTLADIPVWLPTLVNETIWLPTLDGDDPVNIVLATGGNNTLVHFPVYGWSSQSVFWRPAAAAAGRGADALNATVSAYCLLELRYVLAFYRGLRNTSYIYLFVDEFRDAFIVLKIVLVGYALQFAAFYYGNKLTNEAGFAFVQGFVIALAITLTVFSVSFYVNYFAYCFVAEVREPFRQRYPDLEYSVNPYVRWRIQGY